MPSPFVADKQTFFKEITPAKTFGEIDALAKKDFSFLTTHRSSIKHELDGLQAVLRDPADNKQRVSWMYCYYTASMLKNYYDAYSPACANAIKYSELSDLLKKQIENTPLINPEKETLFQTMGNDLSDVLHAPFSNDKLRNWAGKANIHRLSTRFSMITAQQSLLLAKQYHYLDGLERLLEQQVNIDVLNAPVGVYNALSVGLFGCRFFLNLCMIAKHTFLPAPEEKISMGARFYEEIKERHFIMTNDFVWGVINALTNFAPYFHVAAPVANYLLIGFTVFDMVWLSYSLYRTDEDYTLKRKEYIEYRDALDKNAADYQTHVDLENEKLDKLALEHEKARAAVVFNLVAGGIFFSSLAVVFLFSPPAFVPVCFLMANLAIAMFLSADKYGVYKEKNMLIKQQQDNGLTVTTDAKKDVQKAWDDLCFTVTKNTVVPLVIMGAFTVSFPAAILLTLTYFAYECGYLTRLPELFESKAATPALN